MLRRTYQFLKDNPAFYLATLDGNVPRVRPFGLVIEYNGRLYFGTANTKDVYRQIQSNPRIEISTTSSDNEWFV
ncbi:MAG: pyridoxamine 5'-phosphate oxidase family protein [Planctomycetaceae bacterium]|jgi:uncharacterized pyridoxamine 5'-phosphate oxidase family protein|nr:pyridoxamine 5'-phosphate oxidase family protein [Planctomycetaceae bacterium]